MSAARFSTAGIAAAVRRAAGWPMLPMLPVLVALLALAAPAWAADPGRGQQVYARHCAFCHGEGGRPVWPGTPDFKRSPVLLKPDAQLAAAIRAGRGAMPAYAGVIRDRDLPDLLAYLRTLN